MKKKFLPIKKKKLQVSNSNSNNNSNNSNNNIIKVEKDLQEICKKIVRVSRTESVQQQTAIRSSTSPVSVSKFEKVFFVLVVDS